MASRHEHGGVVLSRLIEQYGWGWRALHRVSGVAESTIRKYASGQSTNPDPQMLYPLASVFGSQAGGEILRAFGMAALAERLDEKRVKPLTPLSTVEEVAPTRALEFDERLTRLEEMVEEIHRELVGSNSDKPG